MIINIIASPLGRVRLLQSIVMCVFVCLLTYLENLTAKPHQIFMLVVNVARSSTDSVGICYVIPVLWMTTRFHTVVLHVYS